MTTTTIATLQRPPHTTLLCNVNDEIVVFCVCGLTNICACDALRNSTVAQFGTHHISVCIIGDDQRRLCVLYTSHQIISYDSSSPVCSINFNSFDVWLLYFIVFFSFFCVWLLLIVPISISLWLLLCIQFVPIVLPSLFSLIHSLQCDMAHQESECVRLLLLVCSLFWTLFL